MITTTYERWSFWELYEAPEWLAERVILWGDTLGEWQKAEADKAASK